MISGLVSISPTNSVINVSHFITSILEYWIHSTTVKQLRLLALYKWFLILMPLQRGVHLDTLL